MVKEWIQKWITRIRGSTFIKSVLTLSAGVVTSQAIAIFTTPVISRIYNPQILGEFSVITSNSTIIGTIICMGLTNAIMLPADDDQAKGICRLLLKLIVGGATVLLLLALVLSRAWQMFSVSLPYGQACTMLWLIVILTNVSSVCYAYTNRQRLYKVLFWNPSLGTVMNAVISITLGLLGFGLWGYLLGNIISKALIICHMLRHANPFREKIGYGSIALLKEYRDFPLVMLPSDLVGTVSTQLPVLLLDRFWGSFVLGSYSMCMTILKLPARFLAGPVNHVFYREATERVNRGENIGEFSFSLIKANIKLAIIPFFALIVLGRPLFMLVLGSEWGQAGDFASVLSFSILLSFCTTCLSGKFIIIGRKKTILGLNIIGLTAHAAVFLVSYWLGLSEMSAITLYALTSGFLTILDMSVFMKQTGVPLVRFYWFVLLYILLPVLVGTVLRGVVQSAMLR